MWGAVGVSGITRTMGGPLYGALYECLADMGSILFCQFQSIKKKIIPMPPCKKIFQFQIINSNSNFFILSLRKNSIPVRFNTVLFVPEIVCTVVCNQI